MPARCPDCGHTPCDCQPGPPPSSVTIHIGPRLDQLITDHSGRVITSFSASARHALAQAAAILRIDQGQPSQYLRSWCCDAPVRCYYQFARDIYETRCCGCRAVVGVHTARDHRTALRGELPAQPDGEVNTHAMAEGQRHAGNAG